MTHHNFLTSHHQLSKKMRHKKDEISIDYLKHPFQPIYM